jgi:[acyl-carrier-protein] S-malonyltransferase
MPTIAFLFPGQGSQRVGMGLEFCEADPKIRAEVFEAADRILGLPISTLCFLGPPEALVRTENTQPGIFLASMAALAALRAAGLRPDVVAGHSLGEYSALVGAGALAFEDALRIVRRRGELMAEVAAKTPGAMAAIIGLTPEAVEACCAEASAGGLVEVANYNAPDQTVVSGERGPVEAAMALAQARGASQVVALPVGAPFHCSLMRDLREEFAAFLERFPIRDPAIPVVANVSGDYVRDAAAIRAALVAQVAAPVRWTRTMERLVAGGLGAFIEAGPSRVLTGLAGRFAGVGTALSVDGPKRLAAARARLAGPR